MAKIVLFNSIKGGVGKSTLAAQFVVYLLKKGKNIAVFDGDSQQSLGYWTLRRNHSDKNLEKVFVIDSSEPSNIEKYRDKFDYIVADSAGIDSTMGRFLLSVADVIVSPLHPKQSSIDTLSKHNNLLEQALSVRKKKFKSYYVLNMCSTHSWDKKRSDSLAFLNKKRQEKQICSDVIQTPIYQRELLDTTFSDGESCFDRDYSNKSKNELSLVIDKILGE